MKETIVVGQHLVIAIWKLICIINLWLLLKKKKEKLPVSALNVYWIQFVSTLAIELCSAFHLYSAPDPDKAKYIHM